MWLHSLKLHSWNPPFINEGGLISQNLPKKGVCNFSHKKGHAGKLGKVVLNKGVSLIFILTLSNVIFLWVFGLCVYVLFILFIYTISISILCVSRTKCEKGGELGWGGGGVGENKTEGSLHKIGVARNPLPTIG